MGLSASQLQEICTEIGTSLDSGFIRRIDQPNRQLLILEIENRAARHRLLFSIHPQFSRAHISTTHKATTPKPLPFCQLLRARLRHKRILSFKQVQDDRIIHLRIAWSLEAGAPTQTLVAELTGPSSNLFLLDENAIILGCARRPGEKRGLFVGMTYQPPSQVSSRTFKETLLPQGTEKPFPKNKAADQFYFKAETDIERATRIKDALVINNKALKQSIKRERSLLRQIEEAEKSSRFKDYGEGLKNILHTLAPRATSFILHQAEPPKAISLDPRYSASKNMALFFERYKKSLIALKKLHPLRQENALIKARLESERIAIDAGQLPELKPLPSEKTLKDQKKNTLLGVRTYLSSDNLRILLGKSDRENDQLTFRIARGNDLWFHARGTSGAHVLVRMEGKKAIPPRTLVEAASLALYFSRFKKEGKGEVMYTHKKYLQRPKKGKPGAVIPSQEKTIYIELDMGKLSNLLENRLA